MNTEELLNLSKEELVKYCMSLETTDEDGWQKVGRKEDGYYKEGSKWNIYYYQVEWERDGYLLSYQFNEHSDHDSLYLILNEIEPDSVYLRKKNKVEITVLAYLFLAKKELEDSKIKEEQHALGYINEAIKWVQTINITHQS